MAKSSTTSKSTLRSRSVPSAARARRIRGQKEAWTDERMQRSLSTITGLFMVGFIGTLFVFLIGAWATLKPGIPLTTAQWVTGLLWVLQITVLGWCFYLLYNRNQLVIWVLIGYLSLVVIVDLFAVLVAGVNALSGREFVTLLFQGLIVVNLFQLKKQGLLV